MDNSNVHGKATDTNNGDTVAYAQIHGAADDDIHDGTIGTNSTQVNIASMTSSDNSDDIVPLITEDVMDNERSEDIITGKITTDNMSMALTNDHLLARCSHCQATGYYGYQCLKCDVI